MLNPTRTAVLGVAMLTAAVGISACTSTHARPQPVTTVAVSWQSVTLPAPPGAQGRPSVKDAVVCGGHWFVVGEMVDPSASTTAGAATSAEDATSPAAWTSTDDGHTWASLTVAATSYYGKQDELFSAACRDGQLAVIGQKSGGAHGNPRVATFYQQGDKLVEVLAGFTVYGGSEALNVGRLAAGPKGWMIGGNRVTGAAAWVSADATDFQLVENAPGLASDPSLDTFAEDPTATATGWVMVGGGTTTGHVDRDPMAWTSPDGTHWTRQAVPHDSTYEEMQRAVTVGSDVVGVGLRGGTFGAWKMTGGTWTAAGRFGSTGDTGFAGLFSATVAGGDILVASQDGSRCALWMSADAGATWRSVALPAGLFPAGQGRGIAVGGDGTRLLLIADDGVSARAWIAHLSA